MNTPARCLRFISRRWPLGCSVEASAAGRPRCSIQISTPYDPAGRVTQRTVENASGVSPGPHLYTYDVGGHLLTSTNDAGSNTYSYDAAGRVTHMSDVHGHEIEYEYDVLDRATAVQVRESATGVWQRSSYDYDAAGNLERITEPDGDVVTMTYDAGNRLTSRTLPNGVVSTWTYDLGGRIASVLHEDSAGNVIARRDYTRLPSGEPTRIERNDGGDVSASDIGLDGNGRIETEALQRAGVTENARRYGYDDDGSRALRVLDEGTANEVTETSVLAAGSELQSITRTGASTEPDTYSYDDAGRMTQLVRGGLTYDFTYDADDELIRVGRDGVLAWAASFDANGRRVTTTSYGPLGSTERRFLHAPALADGYEAPHLVTDDLGALQASYVYMGSEHALIRLSASGDETYYLRDAVGTVIATVDDAGTVTARFDYDAFGSGVASNPAPLAATGGDIAYQGMWRDAGVLDELGIYFIRARVYDAATGRFTTRDPALGQMLRPETYWPYVFAQGNPAWWRDPSGRTITTGTLSEVPIGAVIMAVLAVTAAPVVANLIELAKDLEAPSFGCELAPGPIGYDEGKRPEAFRDYTYLRQALYLCGPGTGVSVLRIIEFVVGLDLERRPAIPDPPAASVGSVRAAVDELRLADFPFIKEL